MAGFLGEGYLWVKALHLLAVISWMAGMLYLPRLYVYHCDAEPGSKQSETFKVMERRLMRAIINPAMTVTWLAGLALAAHLDAWGEAWFHGKLALVEATPAGYREKSAFEPLDGKCWTVPTLAGGRLYLRNEKQMVALDVGVPAS